MEIPDLISFRNEMQPYGEKIQGIRGRIDAINQALCKAALDLNVAQVEMKMEFLKKVNALKVGYKAGLPIGVPQDAYWSIYVNVIRMMLTDMANLGICLQDHELNHLFDL
jgi:hypothetical protein